MARTKKKRQFPAYEFSVTDADIVERAAFGRFEVIKAKHGIMYKNYTGYHVWTTPYVVDENGRAQEKSLYAWLDNLLQFKANASGREGEYYDWGIPEDARPGGDNSLPPAVTYGDMLDTMSLMTEANIEHPTTVFTDENYAAQFAIKRMAWMREQMERLQEAMKTPVKEETEDDIKRNFEDAERERIMRESLDILTEGVGLDKNGDVVETKKGG